MRKCYRFEVQRYLARPKVVIESLLDDPSDQRYAYVTQRCQYHFNTINGITIQVLSKIWIPGLLCLLILIKTESAAYELANPKDYSAYTAGKDPTQQHLGLDAL